MLFPMIDDFEVHRPMRTTLALDDELLKKAQEYTGVKEKSALVHRALTLLVEREAARRLARLGGRQPGFAAGRRRRPKFA
jgi:Arc/MetJ family transcription regulator